MRKVIKPENSALGIRKAPSPMLPRVFTAINSLVAKQKVNPVTLDHGCGQLRNIRSLLDFSNQLILVDTEKQLTKKHNFLGEYLTIQEYITKKYPEHNIRIFNSDKFEVSQLNIDIVFSINVLDVTPPKIRGAALRAIRKNLRDNGILVLIVPRNDSWTLQRCSKADKFADGYVFPNHGAFTFYRNWDDFSLEAIARRYGFVLLQNLSVYRYGCILCRPIVKD